MEIGVRLIKKCKEHVSTLQGDTSKKKPKSIIATFQANENGDFWNEGVKLWTDRNMKFFRRKAIHSVNADDHVIYKYVE